MNFEFGLNQNPKATDILQLQLASITKTFSILSAEDSQGKHKNRVGTNRYQPLQFWVYKGKGTDFCFWPFGLFSKYLYPRPDVHSGFITFYLLTRWVHRNKIIIFILKKIIVYKIMYKIHLYKVCLNLEVELLPIIGYLVVLSCILYYNSW